MEAYYFKTLMFVAAICQKKVTILTKVTSNAWSLVMEVVKQI